MTTRLRHQACWQNKLTSSYPLCGIANSQMCFCHLQVWTDVFGGKKWLYSKLDFSCVVEQPHSFDRCRRGGRGRFANQASMPPPIVRGGWWAGCTCRFLPVFVPSGWKWQVLLEKRLLAKLTPPPSFTLYEYIALGRLLCAHTVLSTGCVVSYCVFTSACE